MPSVLKGGGPSFEVLVVDNASEDGTLEWLSERHPEVRVVRNEANLGFAGGNNSGVEHARGEYLIFLNNDVEVETGWLAPLVTALDADEAVGAAQPKLLQHEHRDRFEYAGAAGGYLDRYGYPFTRGRMFNTMEVDSGQYDSPVDIFWATGAALIVRKDVFVRSGGFDESFYMHMEEIDLCWRLQRAGYRIVFVPLSRVYHIGGASLPPSDPRKVYLNFRNNLLTLYKNLPADAWRAVAPVRVALDLAAFFREILTGRLREARAIFQAYRDGHRMRGAYEEQRPGPDEPVVLPTYRGSIVIDYFLCGRRRFSRLPADRFV